jgi:hypothetical protein
MVLATRAFRPSRLKQGIPLPSFPTRWLPGRIWPSPAMRWGKVLPGMKLGPRGTRLGALHGGKLTEGVILWRRAWTGRRRWWGAGGVVEAAGEVVGEELLSDAELVIGSAGSQNNWRRLPPMACSRRKMTSWARSQCRRGSVTRWFFWSGRRTRRRLIGDWRWWVKRRLVRSRATRRQ